MQTNATPNLRYIWLLTKSLIYLNKESRSEMHKYITIFHS